MEELTGWPARPLPERNVDEKTDYVGLIFIFVNDIFINNFAYFASWTKGSFICGFSDRRCFLIEKKYLIFF